MNRTLPPKPEDLVTIIDDSLHVKYKDAFIPCKKEPIHVPGSIQSHGALIALSLPQLKVEYISENVPSYFGAPHITPQDFFDLKNFTKLIADSHRDHFRHRVDSLQDASRTGADGFVLKLDIALFWKSSKYREALQRHLAQSRSPQNPGMADSPAHADSFSSLGTVTSPTDQRASDGGYFSGVTSSSSHPPSSPAAMQGNLPDALAGAFESSSDEDDLDASPYQTSFYCSLHRSTRNPNLVVLEFEQYNALSHQAYDRFFFSLNSLVHSFESAKTIPELCGLAVQYVRNVTGYDRVMMYRFDNDWHGVVIAEEINPEAEVDSYMGIHFPASDIPKQARDLYLLNKSRYVVNRSAPTPKIIQAERKAQSSKSSKPTQAGSMAAAYQQFRAQGAAEAGLIPMDEVPVGDVPAVKARVGSRIPYGKPLDMTYCHLRTMSPIHLIYLGNMGVESSMSIAIVVYGVLWGLICCHHFAPLPVTYQARTACAYLGTLVSTHLENMINHTRFRQCDQVRKWSEEYWVKNGLKRAAKPVSLEQESIEPAGTDTDGGSDFTEHSGTASEASGFEVTSDDLPRPRYTGVYSEGSEDREAGSQQSFESDSGSMGSSSFGDAKSRLVTQKLREGIPSIRTPLLSDRSDGRDRPHKVTDADWATAYDRFIRACGPDICKLVEADYALFMIRDRATAIPAPSFIPDPKGLEKYVKYVQVNQVSDIIVSNNISKDFNGIKSSQGLAGVVHIPLSDDFKDWVVFCKMEEIEHVTWAGEPRKSMQPATLKADPEGAKYLMPRASFNRWTQIIEGKSSEWMSANPELLLTIRSVFGESLKTWKNKMLAIDNKQALNKNVQLEQAKRIAEESDKQKSMLLANVSHEVRTPLHAISGIINLILDTAVDQEQQDMLEEAREASSSLTAIINNLLDVSKMDGGALVLKNESFDLPKTVRSAANMYRKQIEAKNVAFIVQTDPSLPQYVRGDKQRVKQILGNFISNAIKNTETGSIMVDASLSDVRSDGRVDVDLRVTDSGVGIPEDKQSLIFEKFEQVDNSLSRSVSGTGLGLAIAQTLTTNMGGKIGFLSSHGRGSDFYVILPFEVVVGENAREQMRTAFSQSGSATSPYARSPMERSKSSYDVNDLDARIAKLFTESPDNTPTDRRTPEPSVDPAITRTKQVDARDSKIALPPPSHIEFDAHKPQAPTSPMSPVHLTEDQLLGIPDDPNISLNVLVVEDNMLNQTLILRMLKRMKYTTEVANNGREAVRLYVQKNEGAQNKTMDTFDVILMDLQMPVMDGFEATKHILDYQKKYQEQNDACLAPVIAVTAQAMRGDRELCLNQGMKGYISKPIDFSVLQSTLEAIRKQKILHLRLEKEQNTD